MSQDPPRRTFLRVAGSAIPALIAGCMGDENPTPAPSESPTESPTASPTPTETSSPTDEPVGTGDNPDDIVVVNRVESAQSISVQVDKQGESTVFSETFELDGGERAGRDIFDYETAGVFVITAQLPDGTEESYEWDLSEEPAGGWLYISIEEGNKIEMTWAYA